MFTTDERDRARDRILDLARADARVVAGAMVGSLATGPGDAWSDLDLTFGLADGVSPATILADWTTTLEHEFQAAHLFDVPFRSSLYRVFLFPGNLQVDLSFTPAAEFGALSPKFKLLFGTTVPREHVPPPVARHLFGEAVHHAVRARVCIERGRLWEAEHWVGELRDHALSLACLRRGLEARHARGFDALPEEVTGPMREALVRSIDREELRRALSAAIEALLRESGEVGELATKLAAPLRELAARDD